MPQGRRLRIAAVMVSAVFLVALAGHGTASGLDVPSTPTVTTPTLDTGSTVGTVTNTVGTVTDTVNNTANTLPAPTPPPPSTTTSPTSTVNNTVGTVTDTVKNAPKTVSNTVTKPTSTTSPTAQSSPTSGSGVTNTLSTAVRTLTGSTGSGPGSGGGSSGSGYSGPGTTGSGLAGPGVFGGGGGSAGAAPGGGGPASSGPVYSTQVKTLRSILDYLAGGSRIGGAVAGAALIQLRESLSLLQGCFYGLSGRERRVLSLRAGLGGGRPHSRSYVADRLNTTPANVRRIEQNALSTLGGLADTTGCASGPGAAAAVADGYISPAELARAPQLVTLANPFYQGAGHSQFSRLGTVSRFAPGLSAPRIGEDARTNAIWALQLMAVMLGLGLVGIIRGAPAIASWLQLRRARLRVPAVAARSREPAPRPVHRQAQGEAPVPERARPTRREIPS